MTRIAVTGATGLVGRAVVDLALAQGHSVVSIEHAPPAEAGAQPGLTHLQVEMTDYQAVEQALRGCDALVHLAAIPSPLRHPDYVVHNNNVVSSYNALGAATRLGITRVCIASSVNATGGVFSRRPRYDYFPLDEAHPTYNEDPYSLSKWIGEQQSDSFARRHESLAIASLRFHAVMPHPVIAADGSGELAQRRAGDLWGYTSLDATARACLLALTADFQGHEVFYIVAPRTVLETPSLELHARFFPAVPLRGDLSGNRGFYNCAKAERLLGWTHDTPQDR
jgi:nucleoside-diphosphate-sugar epimerase